MKTLTLTEVRNLLTVELPEFASEQWEFDHAEVIDFHKFHKLQYPIRLKTRTGNKYRYGTHYAPSSRNNMHHVIVMNADLSAEAANEWFLHELRQ